MTLIDELSAALDSVVVDAEVLHSYRRDHGPVDVPAGLPAALVRPRTTAEVATAVEIAQRHATPIVPRGAGTGLAGAANAIDGCIMISLELMNQILRVDPVEKLAVVQPGVITADVRRAAEPYGLWYPPDPSSHEISTIGGNIATNAGGLCCVKYGVTRQSVISLEVVLADGRIVRFGSSTRKGVVGYDFVGLITGSEGTLGIVTEATLRLRTKPQGATTVVAAFATTDALAAALDAVHRCGVEVSLFEVMDNTTINAVEDLLTMGLDRGSAGLVFLQVDGPAAGREKPAQEMVAALDTAGPTERYTTDDDTEGELLLTARRAALSALEQRGTTVLDDICVPVGELAATVSDIADIAQRHGVKIATFGHAGDGNLHPTLVLDEHSDHSAAWAAFDEIIETARRRGGTASGEHGVGALKNHHAKLELGADVVGLHEAVKRALDPKMLLNPARGW